MRPYHWLVLTPAVVMGAACSPRADAAVSKTLERDLAEFSRRGPVPAMARASTAATLDAPACHIASAGASTPASAADQARAATLVRRGIAAELGGNLSMARTSFGQAARLDPANPTSAYHLGRIDEQSSDPSGARREYCRYLALSPSATDAAEVRERLRGLTEPQRVASAGAARERARIVPVRSTPVPSATATAPTMERTVAIAPDSGAQERREPRDTLDGPGAAAGQTTAASTHVESSNGSIADDARQSRPAPTPRAPAAAGSMGRDVMVGAAAGAVLGAVMGRNARSSAIGAAAGGVLGAVVGRGGERQRW